MDEEFVRDAERQVQRWRRNEKRFWWVSPAVFFLFGLAVFALFATKPPLEAVPGLLCGVFGNLFTAIVLFKMARSSLKRHQAQIERSGV